MPPKNAGGQRGYSVCDDQWGMLALTQVLGVTDQSEGMKLVTCGFDIATLGLSLVSPDPLHTTFASPWVDGPTRIQPEFRTPGCYTVTPPPLRFVMFQKFHVETLFYVFYSMPRDVLQLAAAQELYNRDWRFHKELKMWLTRSPGTEPALKHPTHEKGSYIFWNPDTWVKDRKDNFVLQYEKLEEKANPQQQTAPQPK